MHTVINDGIEYAYQWSADSRGGEIEIFRPDMMNQCIAYIEWDNSSECGLYGTDWDEEGEFTEDALPRDLYWDLSGLSSEHSADNEFAANAVAWVCGNRG
jgi:hypothetical protein